MVALAIVLSFLLVPLSAARADTTADLQTVNGDGGSIGEWYVNQYAGGNSACDAMCAAIGDQLAGTNAQASGDSVESSALGEGDDLATEIGGSDLLEGLAAAAPEVAAAAGAGYLAYKIGTRLFGSPASSAENDSQGGFYGPFYPAGVISYESSPTGDTTCPGSLSSGEECSAYSVNMPDGTTRNILLFQQQRDGFAEAFTAAAWAVYNGGPSGSILLSEGNAQCTSESACTAAGFDTAPRMSNGAFNDPQSSGGYAYLPYNSTPEPSTFQPTGGGAVPTVSREPAPSSPAAAGTAIETTINNEPATYGNLIHVFATAHQTAAATSGGTSETGSSSQSSTESGTTGAGGSTVPNPTPATLTVPAITDGQIGSAYVQELQADGFTAVTTYTLQGDEIDLAKDPEAAVSVDPIAGTKIAASQTVTVDVNPTDSPAGGSSGGSDPLAPTLPGITVPGAPTPCNVFPFGIPCWAADQLGSLNASPVAPSWTLKLPQLLGGGGWTISLGDMFGFNFGDVMDIVRPVLLAASLLGIFMWLAGLAMGGSTPSGGDGGSSEGDD